MLVFLPGLLIAGLNDVQRKFLNNFGMNKVSFYTGLLGGICHVGFCYLFVNYFDLKINGLGLAMTCTQSVILIGMLIYTKLIPEI